MLAATTPVSAHAPTTSPACVRYASPGGSDANPGSRARPLRTVRRLVARLTPGQAGCLLSGTFRENVDIRRGGTKGHGVVLRGAPGARATLAGRLVVHDGVKYLTIGNLKLVGPGGRGGPSPTIDGDHILFTHNDITNPGGNCVFVGSTQGWGIAEGVRVYANRIHNCGTMPPTNQEHGMYVQASRDLVIEGNLIYANADRGIQLYPDAQRTIIRHNVIWGNGEGVIISGDGPYASSGTRIVGNIIASSRVRHNIESYWPGRTGTDNVVGRNCMWGGAQGNIGDIVGFAVATRQLVTNPGFIAPAKGDFRMRRTSACASFGPRAVRRKASASAR